jgi:peptidoglycan/LPS O-acetylase OafA/YrhL
MIFGWLVECFRVDGLANIEVKELFLNLLMLQDISSLKPNVIVDPYMHNSPLWSLSYEWWFYMLYFLIQKFITNKGKDILVYGLAAASALLYLYYPVFLPRLLMYMSIWWVGVSLSNLYIKNDLISIEKLRLPLICIAFICFVNAVRVFDSLDSGTYLSVGVHPALELRHHLFAMVVVFLAVFWKSKNWFLFDKIFSPFLWLAPISYVLYISHYYFVVRADYFSFINNKFLEIPLYFFVAFLFSYIVEKIIFPPAQKMIMSMANNKLL